MHACAQPHILQKREFLCRYYDNGPDFAAWEPEGFLPKVMVRAYIQQGVVRVARAKQKQTELAQQDDHRGAGGGGAAAGGGGGGGGRKVSDSSR